MLGRNLLVGCYLLGSASSSSAAEQRIKFGPNNVAVMVNDVRIEANLSGSAIVDSANGDANIEGEVTASSNLTQLQDRVRTVADSLLPYTFKSSPCTITVDQLNELKLVYPPKSYELRLGVSLSASLHCGVVNPKGDVVIDLAAQPYLLNPKTLGWKILRKPRVQMPFSWRIAMELVGADPSSLFLEKARTFLDQHATYQLPAMQRGLDATFKGANFDGQNDTLQFRVKADAHADSAGVTSLLQAYLDQTPLVLKFQMPETE